jgi:hypothetical protein
MEPLKSLADHKGPWISLGEPKTVKPKKGQKKKKPDPPAEAPKVSTWWLLAAGAGGMLLLGLFQAWKRRQDQRTTDLLSSSRPAGQDQTKP